MDVFRLITIFKDKVLEERVGGEWWLEVMGEEGVWVWEDCGGGGWEGVWVVISHGGFVCEGFYFYRVCLTFVLSFYDGSFLFTFLRVLDGVKK